jgi:glycosyl transferase, family 25
MTKVSSSEALKEHLPASLSTPNPKRLEFFVISLPESNARRRMVSEMLQGSPYSWRIFDACTAMDNTLPYDPERAIIRYGRRLTSGEIGCFVSHYRCLKEFSLSDSAADYMLVLEDDVWIDPRFDFAGLPEILERLDIHFMMLHTRHLARSRFLGRVGNRLIFRFAAPPYGTQAYIVSKKGACEIVKAIHRIDRPIDDEMERYWINGLPTYALFPHPVIELNFESTVPKGVTDLRRMSLGQRVLRNFHIWVEKISRRYANILLRRDDCRMSRKLGKDFMSDIPKIQP